MPTTRVGSRADGSGERLARVEGSCDGSGVPTGGFGDWYGPWLSGGGHDVVEGSTSLQNKSGMEPPFAAPTLFWRDGGVGGSGMLSILANHAWSH